MTKPRAVLRGATFGIVSPASTPQPAKVEAGIAALHALGYGAKVFPHALSRGPMYYAGTAQERVADLHAAFEDSQVDAVLCTRGGWGSAELLPLLDVELIRAHSKAFLGYSDHTSLHLWLRNEAGLISFQAPMLAADFSRPAGVDLASFHAALHGDAAWSLDASSGLRVLQSGVAEGELSGGCMALYAESLGTPWSARPRGGVLMLEDIHVKPFQWDRMLVHLRHAGLLAGVQGICFGDMHQSCPAEEHAALEASLLHALSGFRGPIAIGLRSGHVDRGNITLPLGVRVRLDLSDSANPQMHFLEPAVQV